MCCNRFEDILKNLIIRVNIKRVWIIFAAIGFFEKIFESFNDGDDGHISN